MALLAIDCILDYEVSLDNHISIPGNQPPIPRSRSRLQIHPTPKPPTPPPTHHPHNPIISRSLCVHQISKPPLAFSSSPKNTIEPAHTPQFPPKSILQLSLSYRQTVKYYYLSFASSTIQLLSFVGPSRLPLFLHSLLFAVSSSNLSSPVPQLGPLDNHILNTNHSSHLFVTILFNSIFHKPFLTFIQYF